MSSMTRFSGPWLRRLRRARLGTADTLVGVQWAGAELVLARVLRDDVRPEIGQCAILPAPPESRADLVNRLAGGDLLNGVDVVLTLAPGQYDLHQVAAPAVPPEEMREALRWQLRTSLAYAPEEAAIDFVHLPQGAESHTRETLLVVTAHRPVVSAAIAPFLSAGVHVAAVDIPEFAQRNLARLGVREEGTHAWLGFERETCLLTAHLKGELAFARRMLLPGAGQNAIEMDSPESIAHVTERIVTQAQRTLDTFERQSGLPPVAQIVVGPHRNAEAIGAALTERTGVATRLFSGRETFDFGRNAQTWAQELPPAALPAIGAALRIEDESAANGLAVLAQRLRAVFKRAA
jgi:MSHA biogenesis protein MshI